jgi:hypothetical protein
LVLEKARRDLNASLKLLLPTKIFRIMKQKNFFIFLALSLLLSGCATVAPSVPETYKGPVVQLSDTGMQDGGTKATFFLVSAIDGREIQNSLRETRSASYGQGFALSARYTSRQVPVASMKVKLIGTHQVAAPIHEIALRIAGSFWSVVGITEFLPIEGKSYVVTGELKKEESCVWIAESESKQVVTEKVCTK